MNASPQSRDQLRRSFFFEPSPRVARVVFIGTPHHGSFYARRCIGKLGSALVEEPAERRREHQRLIACNPGVFSTEVTRRIPTSIDLLDPDSPLLNAISDLPINDRVRIHSVIGDSRWTLGVGPSDGVVPVTSAREFRARSERIVDEKHQKLNGHPDTIHELRIILEEHLREIRGSQSIAPDAFEN